MTWAAPLRGVSSPGCLSSSESSSSFPGDGDLAPSIDGGGGLNSPLGSGRHTPEGAESEAASRVSHSTATPSGRGGGDLLRRPAGCGRGSWHVGGGGSPRSGWQRCPPWAPEQSRGGLFFWFVQGAACATLPFPVPEDPKQKLNRGLGWVGGCVTYGLAAPCHGKRLSFHLQGLTVSGT